MESVKEITDSMTFHEAWKRTLTSIENGETMSFERAWELCDPWRASPRTDVLGWEDARRDYNEWRGHYITAHLAREEAHRKLNELEKSMNESLPGGISDDTFNEHYKLARELQYAWGTELGLMNGYGMAAIVFLDLIQGVKGAMN